MTDAEADIIKRYEAYHGAWHGRCKFLLQDQLPGIEGILMLLADEPLGLIDERLVELEAELPDWYPVDRDWHRHAMPPTAS